ncbi:MAG: hypothetical protein ACHQU1_04460, partial [Gemmatimonadales bacterium]
VAVSGTAQYDVISSQMNLTVTGTSAGQVRWDLDHGRLDYMSSRSSGQIRIPELGQSMPFRMTMTMALVDQGDPPRPTPDCTEQ